jgi:putative ABC transport system permease protein
MTSDTLCVASSTNRPSFSLLIGILALGIAASIAVFSLVDAVLLRPLPYRDPHRLVMLTSFDPNPPFASNGSLSHSDFEVLKAKTRSFDDLAITFRQGWSRVTLTGGTGPQWVQGAFVSPNLFTMFGRAPILGRTFTPEENLRAERVVVISQGLWADRFGSLSQVLGQDLEIGHARWRVIGVMPSDFQVPFLDVQLWTPMLAHPDWNDPTEKNFQQRPFWDVMARLKHGVSLRTAQSEVSAIENGLKAALPESHPNNVRIVPLREHFTHHVQRSLWMLFAAVALLLAIACANVANLLLGRAAERGRELAVRSALGAGQRRLIGQLLTEAVTFSCIAGALGTFAASIFLPVLKALSPANIPLLQNVELNERSLFFALAISIAVGLLLGVAPAWQMSRRDYQEVLNTAGRRTTETRGSRRLKSFLVAAEFALAMILLTGAGLLFRSFVGVLHTDIGFHPENILTVQLGLTNSTSPSKTAQFYRDVIQRIAEMPGVRAVGGAGNLFFLEEKRTHALRQVEGRPPEPKSSWTPLVWTQISGDYFQAMGIPVLAGRYFNHHDGPATPPVAIVNETLARRYWRGENPVGRRLKGFDPRGRNDDWVTVVGVVKDTRSGGLEKPAFSQIYEVQEQSGEQIGNLVVRTATDPALIAGSIRTLIHQANRNAIVSSITTMEQLLDRQVVERRFETWLIGVFSAFALSLAALGVFAVMYYSVASKTHEIGVRMALGACATDMTAFVLRQGARLALTGIMVGTLGALWSSYAIAGMLYKVKPSDPISFVGAGLTLAVVALLGSYVPARRASHVDPMTALRQD